MTRRFPVPDAAARCAVFDTEMRSPTKTPRRLGDLTLLLVAAAFVVCAYVKFAAALRFEDALIVLRYARNIVAGQGMVFNPGERVLGVSTPLFTLVSTLFVAAGAPTAAPDLQNLFGIVCLAVEAALAGLLTRRFGLRYLAVPVQILVLGNFGSSYLYFGMEVHLFAALVFGAYLLLLDDRYWALGIVLGIAFLVRYDAALLALLVGISAWIRRRRPPVEMVVLFAAIVLPWLVFAWSYFGTILPEPLRSKSGQAGFVEYLLRAGDTWFAMLERLGAVYVPRAWVGPAALLCAALIGFGAARLIRRDARGVVVVLHPLLHVLVYAAIGADPRFAWHLYLVTPLSWFLLVVGLSDALAAAERRIAVRETRWAAPAIAVVLVVPLLVSLAGGMLRPYRADDNTRELWRIAEWIDPRYPDRASLMNPSIGILGWVTNLRIIDQAGLVTPGLRYHAYHDDREPVSLGRAVARFRPDLVLLLEPEDDALVEAGYERVPGFDASPRYRLYGRKPR